MQYDVEVMTYYDHARKKYVYEEGWLRSVVRNNLTITSIGVVVHEDDLKVDMVFDFSSEEVEIDEIIKSAIIKREKIGTVELEMIE